MEIETRALVTKEIQSVDENEKPLYSAEDKENLVHLANTVLKPKLVVSIEQLRNTAVEVHLVAEEIVSEYQTVRITLAC